jgi:small-conductance mechanosensitive channel
VTHLRRLGFLSLTLIACLVVGGRLQAQQGRPAGEAETSTAPVTLDGVVLFNVRGVSSLPAEERARRIEERLRAVAADPTVPVESLRMVESEDAIRIFAGDTLIMGVVDPDASLEQVRRADLAGSHLGRLRQAIADYRAARSGDALRRGAINSALGTLLLAAAIFAVIQAWRWVDRLVSRRLASRIHSVQIQSLELIRREHIWDLLRSVLFAVRTVVLLAMFLIYFGFVLAQFPRTRGLSQNMVAFALGPLQVMGNAFVAKIPSLVFLIVLYFVVRLVLRLIRMFFDAVDNGTVQLAQFDREWAVPTYKIVRVAVIAFALVVAYPYIPGSDSAAFSGISLFIGVLFSLGSSSAIANIIAGYMLTYRRALKVGERVKIGDAFGDVTAIGLQATHLRSVKNEEITIANSQILASEVINYSSLAKADGLILHTEVGIGYETPWRHVEAMLVGSADRTAGILKEPRPFVRLLKLDTFAVTYELNAYCGNAQAMGQLYADLHRNVLDTFNENGVQIMTPAYEGDPAEPKIVPPKDWYTGVVQPTEVKAR